MIHEVRVFKMIGGELRLTSVVSSEKASRIFWERRENEMKHAMRPNNLPIEQIRNIAAAKKRFNQEGRFDESL